jgi:hypothetical protein
MEAIKMANEQKQKTEVKKEVETKKEKVEKVAVLRIADVVRLLGKEGAKDRSALAEKVVAFLKTKNVTINNKHKEITKDAVHSQIGAICRCISKEVGPKVWKNYKIEETENSFKIVAK